ncbi:MAG: M1 family aminopeptidase [Pirellulales bacterium]
MQRVTQFGCLIRLGLLVVFFVMLNSGASADTYQRQPGVDAVHYVFQLKLSDDSREIDGETVFTFRSTVDGLDHLFLDLGSSVGTRGMYVSTVTENGERLEYKHEDDRVAIKLSKPMAAGEERKLSVQYRGVPRSGLRLTQNMYSEWCAFSENWPNRAHQWLATIDHPSDKATGEFIVTAPARYQVIANGLLINETDLPNDLRQTHWKQSVPIPVWLYALGVCRFSVIHYGTADGGNGRQIPLEGWVYPQNRESGHKNFDEPGRSAIEFFTQQVGPYAYEKLAHVQAAGIGGATEHATAVFYGEQGVLRENRGVVVHETAHHWFGNSVTESDWDDVWLSEGFATYFTNLYFEHRDGREGFVERMKRDRTRVIGAERRSPDTPIVHRNISDMSRVLNTFVYQKGGWFLHMLRGQIGDEAFWKGIRAYYAKYRDKNASTADFMVEMEQASGQKLDWLFAQWLTRSGLPRLAGEWGYDPAAKQVRVTLKQTQEADPFRLPLEIAIKGPDGNTSIQKVELTAREGEFKLAAESAPADVLLDPNVWVLMADPEFTKQAAPQ